MSCSTAQLYNDLKGIARNKKKEKTFAVIHKTINLFGVRCDDLSTGKSTLIEVVTTTIMSRIYATRTRKTLLCSI